MPDEELYFDEDVPHELAGLLRGMGRTVHLPRDVGTLSAPDAVHLRTSKRRGWVPVTQNRRDIRRLHWLWMNLYE